MSEVCHTTEYQSGIPEAERLEHDEESPQVQAAAVLCHELDAWLDDSPSNPTYHSSDTYKKSRAWLDAHRPEIEAGLIAEIGGMGSDYVDTDKWKFETLYDRELKVMGLLYEGTGVGPTDFAVSSQEGTDTDRINISAVNAIGALLIRKHYLDSNGILNSAPHGSAPYDAVLRQNILATVQKAAHLEHTLSSQAVLGSSQIEIGAI